MAEIISIVDGLPRSRRHRKFNQADMDIARINNPFVVFGTDPVFPIGAFGSTADPDIIVFLEYVQASTSIIIKGINGASLTSLTSTIVSPLDLTHSPLRIDGGVTITGTILIAKGFYMRVKN